MFGFLLKIISMYSTHDCSHSSVDVWCAVCVTLLLLCRWCCWHDEAHLCLNITTNILWNECWMLVVYFPILHEDKVSVRVVRCVSAVYSLHTLSLTPARTWSRFRALCLMPCSSTTIMTIIAISFSYTFCLRRCSLLLSMPSIHPSIYWKRHKLLFAFLFLFPMSTQYFAYGRSHRYVRLTKTQSTK